MVDQGAVEEVKRVLPYRQENSLNTVGVKEILKYIDGEWPLDFALERLRKNTRVYAKKQLTWFKKDESIRWFHPDDESEILSYLSQNIHKQ
jgi:tRNA dimethylallyltransferase